MTTTTAFTFEQLLPRLTAGAWNLVVSSRGAGRAFFALPEDRTLAGLAHAIADHEKLGPGSWTVRLICRLKDDDRAAEFERCGLALDAKLPSLDLTVNEAGAVVMSRGRGGGMRAASVTAHNASKAADTAAGAILSGETLDEVKAARQARARADKVEQEVREAEARARLERVRREIDTTSSRSPLEQQLAQLIEKLGRPPEPAPPQRSFVKDLVALAPLIAPLLTGLFSGLGKRFDAVLEQLGAIASGLSSSNSSVSSLKETIGTIREVLDVANEVGIGGGGGDGWSGLLGQVLALVQQARGGGGLAGALLPAPAAAPAPARAPLSPEQQADAIARQRVGQLLTALSREARLRTDPTTVAEQLEQLVGLLPHQVREALASEQPAPPVVQSMAQYAPAAAAELQQIMSTAEGCAWIESFRDAMFGDTGEGGEGESPNGVPASRFSPVPEPGP